MVICGFSVALAPSTSSFQRPRQNALHDARKCKRQVRSELRMALLSHEELEVLFDGGDFKTAKYRLECRIAGGKSKDARKDSIRSIKQNARFDGFRKVRYCNQSGSIMF